MNTERVNYIVMAFGLTIALSVYFYTKEPQIPVNEQKLELKKAPTIPPVAIDQRKPEMELLTEKPKEQLPKPTPQSQGSANWNKYPGTLNDQALYAITNQEGQMAFDVAALLFECLHITRQLTPATQQTLPPELVLSLQREYANCQTLAGDSKHIRARLLKLAIEKDIRGAALAGMRSGLIDPPILQNVVRDAKSGDVESLVTITDDKPLTFGISSDTQAALRYALKLASQDPEVGKSIRPYLSLAEATAYALGNSKTKEFDLSGLSEAAKAEARIIAERIINLAKQKPKS